MDYHIELKELQALELMNEKFQQEKIVDITGRLQARADQELDFEIPETKMLFEAQDLSVEEISKQYGCDQLSNVIYMATIQQEITFNKSRQFNHRKQDLMAIFHRLH